MCLPQSEMECCIPCAISDLPSEVDENRVFLDYYAASSCNLLPTTQDKLYVPSPGIKKGLIGCPETSLRNYRYSLRINLEESSSVCCTPWICAVAFHYVTPGKKYLCCVSRCYVNEPAGRKRTRSRK